MGVQTYNNRKGHIPTLSRYIFDKTKQHIADRNGSKRGLSRFISTWQDKTRYALLDDSRNIFKRVFKPNNNRNYNNTSVHGIGNNNDGDVRDDLNRQYNFSAASPPSLSTSVTTKILTSLNPFRRQPMIITISIAIMTMLVSVVYMFRWVPKLPCGTRLFSTLIRNFIHLDVLHIISNLYFLILLGGQIESDIGPQRFLMISGIIITLNTLIEWSVTNMINVRCSIGLSGFLFGLLAWKMLYSRGFVSWRDLILITGIVVISSFPLNRISLLGHALGAVAGVLAYPIYGWITKNM